MQGTVSYADIYGASEPLTGKAVVSGQPNAEKLAGVTGLLPSAGAGNAAMFWVGLVILLVLLRVVIEQAEK